MNNNEIIAGLRELAEERRTWFREDGDDEQFRRDYAVLAAAAERMEKDEVPVVRCKDCRYSMFSGDRGECWQGPLCIVRPDDFCSYGERKGEEATT